MVVSVSEVMVVVVITMVVVGVVVVGVGCCSTVHCTVVLRIPMGGGYFFDDGCVGCGVAALWGVPLRGVPLRPVGHCGCDRIDSVWCGDVVGLW